MYLCENQAMNSMKQNVDNKMKIQRKGIIEI